jgi:UDP-N-acetylglucosamine:LPS N-acetylglucosamine transferase
MCLKSIYEKHKFFYVVNDRILLAEDMDERTYFISHSERDFKFFINLYEALKILSKERPKILLSTGAGPIVPFALIGRLFFGCKIIYVETITRINKPSLTGRLMYWIAHDFYYQWKELAIYFPNGRYCALLI